MKVHTKILLKTFLVILLVNQMNMNRIKILKHQKTNYFKDIKEICSLGFTKLKNYSLIKLGIKKDEEAENLDKINKLIKEVDNLKKLIDTKVPGQNETNMNEMKSKLKELRGLILKICPNSHE